MDVVGIHHVALNVDDLDAAMSFYVEGLGFEPLPRPDFGFPGAWLQVGPQQIHLMERPGMPRNDSQHLALEVADLDAAERELVARGIEVDRPRRIDGAGRQVFLADPSGNRIELNQPD